MSASASERHLGSEATNRIGEGVIPGNYCALFPVRLVSQILLSYAKRLLPDISEAERMYVVNQKFEHVHFLGSDAVK